MSTLLGDALPPDLARRLEGGDLDSVADQVIVVLTVDERGWPHPALLSYFEVVAKDRRTIRLATYADSRTTGNARRTGKLTLLLVHARVAYYIKGSVEELARAMRVTPYNAKLTLRVTEVLADEADPSREPGAYVASGVTYVNPRRAADMERARGVLAELLE